MSWEIFLDYIYIIILSNLLLKNPKEVHNVATRELEYQAGIKLMM
jgi:hypothetical protein